MKILDGSCELDMVLPTSPIASQNITSNQGGKCRTRPKIMASVFGLQSAVAAFSFVRAVFRVL